MILISFFVILCLKSLYETATISQGCNSIEWKCHNGECIYLEDYCDGTPHCSDQSDESFIECITNKCSPFSFQCAYGACIDTSRCCDGERDCLDNSDEYLPNCSNSSATPLKLRGSCEKYEYECRSKSKCIDIIDICDGREDCPDGSDEIVEICTSVGCPLYNFRCGYGACISETLVCNGENDCADQSDENLKLCKNNNSDSVVKAEGACIILEIPVNGGITVPNNVTNEIRIGDVIQQFKTIFYSCKPKYKIMGHSNNTCISGRFTSETPKCIKHCSQTVLTDITTNVTCEYTGQGISCEHPLPPGSIAHITCNSGYAKPKTGGFNEHIECDKDGEWNWHPSMCEQVCGNDETPAGVKLIAQGQKVNNTNFPWHVGIYSNLIKRHTFTQICGGTILNAKIVISAAHCFWDPRHEKFHNERHFEVVAGKYYRDYDAPEPLFVQKFKLDSIQAKNGYNDEIDKYNNDLALLILNKPIAFRAHIAPVCFDYNKIDPNIPGKLYGRMAGWGLIQPNGEPSSELKYVELPTVDSDECRESVSQAFRAFITTDKFCAGYLNAGIGACEGDSGGGLVFAQDNGNNKRSYYLSGIVSVAANRGGSCDINKYTVFTNVHEHELFIKRVIQSHLPINKFS